MNFVEIEARVVCDSEQARALMGHVDHVEYGPEHGLARMRVDAEADPRDLLQQTREAIDRLEQATTAVGIDLADGLEFAVRSEALVDDGGVWRRRGDIVPLAAFPSD